MAFILALVSEAETMRRSGQERRGRLYGVREGENCP